MLLEKKKSVYRLSECIKKKGKEDGGKTTTAYKPFPLLWETLGLDLFLFTVNKMQLYLYVCDWLFCLRYKVPVPTEAGWYLIRFSLYWCHTRSCVARIWKVLPHTFPFNCQCICALQTLTSNERHSRVFKSVSSEKWNELRRKLFIILKILMWGSSLDHWLKRLQMYPSTWVLLTMLRWQYWTYTCSCFYLFLQTFFLSFFLFLLLGKKKRKKLCIIKYLQMGNLTSDNLLRLFLIHVDICWQQMWTATPSFPLEQPELKM